MKHLFVVLAMMMACAASFASDQDAAARDYERLSGTWQLTKGIVDGVALTQQQLKDTVLVTDHNTFRFPKASGAGTHPAGAFTVHPNTVPKEVDSVAQGGANPGQVTLGIYEIIDDTHKRACWGPPGGPRPTAFESPPGSKRILQYWEKIGPVPKKD